MDGRWRLVFACNFLKIGLAVFHHMWLIFYTISSMLLGWIFCIWFSHANCICKMKMSDLCPQSRDNSYVFKFVYYTHKYYIKFCLWNIYTYININIYLHIIYTYNICLTCCYYILCVMIFIMLFQMHQLLYI